MAPGPRSVRAIGRMRQDRKKVDGRDDYDRDRVTVSSSTNMSMYVTAVSLSCTLNNDYNCIEHELCDYLNGKLVWSPCMKLLDL